ncbi:hypothetical protein LIER_19851 [Lithospermum erythrorhizon]|uniref:Uncharacterized protein n=1 Tax=Lithospermum erythrorhizon TaxID=34254 RepID=A0AAV3QJE8_LITER
MSTSDPPSTNILLIFLSHIYPDTLRGQLLLASSYGMSSFEKVTAKVWGPSRAALGAYWTSIMVEPSSTSTYT